MFIIYFAAFLWFVFLLFLFIEGTEGSMQGFLMCCLILSVFSFCFFSYVHFTVPLSFSSLSDSDFEKRQEEWLKEYECEKVKKGEKIRFLLGLSTQEFGFSEERKLFPLPESRMIIRWDEYVKESSPLESRMIIRWDKVKELDFLEKCDRLNNRGENQ